MYVACLVRVGYEYRVCIGTVVHWRTLTTSIPAHDMQSSQIGGWNFDVHHAYNFHQGTADYVTRLTAGRLSPLDALGKLPPPMYNHPLNVKRLPRQTYDQFTPTTPLNSAQLNCRDCGRQCIDVISIVTSRCCAQTTRCLIAAWLSS